jgi:hypothetical protein
MKRIDRVSFMESKGLQVKCWSTGVAKEAMPKDKRVIKTKRE